MFYLPFEEFHRVTMRRDNRRLMPGDKKLSLSLSLSVLPAVPEPLVTVPIIETSSSLT